MVMSLEAARVAIRRQAIGEAELRAACAALSQGDWLDQQRGELILALLSDPATAPAPERGLREVAAGLDWADVLGGLAVFVLLFLGMWVAWGLGLPTGGDELMGGLR